MVTLLQSDYVGSLNPWALIRSMKCGFFLRGISSSATLHSSPRLAPKLLRSSTPRCYVAIGAVWVLATNSHTLLRMPAFKLVPAVLRAVVANAAFTAKQYLAKQADTTVYAVPTFPFSFPIRTTASLRLCRPSPLASRAPPAAPSPPFSSALSPL